MITMVDLLNIIRCKTTNYQAQDDRWVHPSLHHPRIEKKGVEIHRSFNAKAMTVD